MVLNYYHGKDPVSYSALSAQHVLLVGATHAQHPICKVHFFF